MMFEMADTCNFPMVVKNFGRSDVDNTDEQRAHTQDAHPVIVPIFSPASHPGGPTTFNQTFRWPGLVPQPAQVPKRKNS